MMRAGYEFGFVFPNELMLHAKALTTAESLGEVPIMGIKRIARHLATTGWAVKRAFPLATMRSIEQAIKSAETTHAGDIRFVVGGALDGHPLFKQHSAKERALEVFSQLRMWDTEDNSGVLIYLLLADRQVEIVADRGIHAKAGSGAWKAICLDMEVASKAKHYEQGCARSPSSGRATDRALSCRRSDSQRIARRSRRALIPLAQAIRARIR